MVQNVEFFLENTLRKCDVGVHAFGGNVVGNGATRELVSSEIDALSVYFDSVITQFHAYINVKILLTLHSNSISINL